MKTLFPIALSKRLWKPQPNNPQKTSPAGYLINHRDGPTGNPGIAFNYLMAGNGLFIEAENHLLKAANQISKARIAGLAPLTPSIHLPHGLLPSHMFHQGLSWQKSTPRTERYFAIILQDGRYRLVMPEQAGTQTAMAYTPQENTVAEFHSHGNLQAFFSSIDDRDEQGFQIYGVVGRTPNPVPQLALRVGIYGNFRVIRWQDVFDTPTAATQPINPGPDYHPAPSQR